MLIWNGICQYERRYAALESDGRNSDWCAIHNVLNIIWTMWYTRCQKPIFEKNVDSLLEIDYFYIFISFWYTILFPLYFIFWSVRPRSIFSFYPFGMIRNQTVGNLLISQISNGPRRRCKIERKNRILKKEFRIKIKAEQLLTHCNYWDTILAITIVH